MKKKKVAITKLSLKKEAVTSLGKEASQYVVGGGQSDMFHVCQPPTFTVDGTIVYTKMHHTCYGCGSYTCTPIHP